MVSPSEVEVFECCGHPEGLGGVKSGFQVRSRCLNVAGTPRGWRELKLCYPEKWFPSEFKVFECCGHPEGLGGVKVMLP